MKQHINTEINNLLDQLTITGLNAEQNQLIREIQTKLVQEFHRKTFAPGTMNGTIFQTNAPYNNPYQGSKHRMLWVCSAGLLRSPTGAFVAAQRGYNTRACGSSQAYALINLSGNLIDWADTIVFVNKENQQQALETFEGTGYDDDIGAKAVILDIPDNYEAIDPCLQKLLNEGLDKLEEIKGLPNSRPKIQS